MTKNPPKSPSQASTPDILILGLGWTSQFLLPLLETHHITYSGTTRDGRNNSIPFTYSPTDDKPSNPASISKFSALLTAKTVLITFPLKGRESVQNFLSLYAQTHPDSEDTKWIQFGSTGIFKGTHWNTEASPIDLTSERAQAEDELLNLKSENATILNLAGLHGGERQVKNWIVRVAQTKEAVKGKTVVHLVHGKDVARAVVLCLERWERVSGKRWILTDMGSHDWWTIILKYGEYARKEMKRQKTEEGREGGEYAYEQWVRELMIEEGVRALPRDIEGLGRLVDGRAFWNAVGSTPETFDVEAIWGQ